MFGKSCHCTLSKVCIVAAVSRNKDVSLGRPRTKEPKVRNNDVECDLLVLPVLALDFAQGGKYPFLLTHMYDHL